MTRLRVAVGVVECDGEVLIAQRQKDKHLAGLWEFPGGKVEPGESLGQALNRELAEELDLDAGVPDDVTAWQTVDFDYSEKSVRLEFVRVRLDRRRGKGVEGQPVRWVAITRLQEVDFPPANRAIIEALQTENGIRLSAKGSEQGV